VSESANAYDVAAGVETAAQRAAKVKARSPGKRLPPPGTPQAKRMQQFTGLCERRRKSASRKYRIALRDGSCGAITRRDDLRRTACFFAIMRRCGLTGRVCRIFARLRDRLDAPCTAQAAAEKCIERAIEALTLFGGAAERETHCVAYAAPIEDSYRLNGAERFYRTVVACIDAVLGAKQRAKRQNVRTEISHDAL
jgi:hypothetical protein